MFCIGQYIVYSNSGICRVEAIGRLSFMQGSQKEYYTLRPFYTTSDARIYVPVHTNVSMRKAMTREEAFGCLEHLKTMEVTLCSSKKQNFLAAYYRELLAAQDVNGYLRVYKEGCQKEKSAKERRKKLGQVDLQFYRLAERMLSEELSIVLQETLDSSKQRLYEAVSSA